MPLTALLRESGDPASAALICGAERYSRGALVEGAEELATKLGRAGVGKGSRVVVTLPNTPGHVLSLFAVNHRGALVLPLNRQLSPDERLQIESIARPHFVIAEHGDVDLGHGMYLTRAAGGDEESTPDVAAIIFTSGTTGRPKGVMLSEEGLVANARAVAGYLRLSEHDRTLLFLPLSYAYALSQLLSTFVAGGSVVLLPNLRYPALAFEAMAEHRVTGFGGVPTSLAILARHQSTARSLESLRYILSAGGPLSSTLVEGVRHAFPGAALFNNYGCTEIGPRATAVDYSANPQKIGSIGRAIEGVHVSIVRPDLSLADVGEIGEIVLSGTSLMKGYFRDPETTADRMSRHGFHTGDYAYADAHGFLYYQGRQDDIFKSAGEKVSATEVEEVVLAHEDVAEAAVVSCPDAILGAVPIVYAVLRPGRSCTDRELQTFCARRLARHKVPREVHFVDELFKTASGKIQKHRLRQTLQ